MSGEHQVVTRLPRSLPNARIMREQNVNIAVRAGNGIRSGNGDGSRTMRQARSAIMNPLAARTDHSVTDSVKSDAAIMVATHGQHRRHRAQLAYELAQFAQLGRAIQQVAAE